MKTEYVFSSQIIEKSSDLGYSSEKVPLLILVPFLQVAWAEGYVQSGEKRAILRFAENFNLKPGHPEYEQLLGWFNERPSEKFFADSIGDLCKLLESIPAKQAARLRSILQFGCVEVAQSVGDIGLLRGRSNICREEQVYLQRLGERLGL